MKIKPIKQPDASACGPTVIKMALGYFAMPASFRDIMRVSKYNKIEGMSNKDLIHAFHSFGLRAKEIHDASWKDLRSMNNKNSVVIVSWMLKGYIGHFSVVEKVTNGHIHLADPAEGKTIRMPRIAFMRLWFDYDDMWFPEKNTDIQLRWLVAVSKKP